MEPIKLVFTSFRNSIDMGGLKVSLDKHMPKPCSYSVLFSLVMPPLRNLTLVNMERICVIILDNNWNLIQDFISRTYELGIRQLVLCCWCTEEQIALGKFCPTGVIGRYIQDKGGEFEFPIEIEYGDGRQTL